MVHMDRIIWTISYGPLNMVHITQFYDDHRNGNIVHENIELGLYANRLVIFLTIKSKNKIAIKPAIKTKI